MASEVYLFTGPEAGEKAEAIENIRKAAEKKNGALGEYRYYSSDVSVAELVAQLQNKSLFEPALFIIYRNAEAVKTKSDVDMMLSWIKGSAQSPNTLVLVSDENSVEKKIESAIASDHKKIFWEMFENRKPQWVESYFKKNGFAVTPDAVQQILEMIENNTEALKAECSRFFFCFEKGHRITVQDVDSILSHNREENAFTLFDAMCDTTRSPSQRLETSLEILQKIRTSSKSAFAIPLISGLVYCFRQLKAYHGLCAGGEKLSDAQLKAAGFASKKKQEQYGRASRCWNGGATSSILALLSSTDIAVREGGSAFEETNVSMMIYSIVIKNGLFAASYDVEV